MNDIWWALPLTIVVFLLARKIADKIKLAIVNPLLITVAVIIALLVMLHMPYARYFQGNAFLNTLVQPAVVALALPLYEQLPHIRRNWKSVIGACFVGSVAAMVSGTAIALWMGATPDIAATVLSKSVTMPVAIAVSEPLGGIPAISAISVFVAGMSGGILGYMIFNLLRIRFRAARGLAMGAASHAIGTARAVESNAQEGAFSSLAMVLCAIITSLLAPFIFPPLLQFLG